MEARHKTETDTTLHSHARVQWFIAVLGIVTAVVSTLVLLQGVSDKQRTEARESRRMEVSKAITGLGVKIKSLTEASVIWVHE